MYDHKKESHRQLIAYYSVSIIILIMITTIDWTVTNFYHLALLGEVSVEEAEWWFFSYQIIIFGLFCGFIILFLGILHINYLSSELKIPIEGLHYFKFIRALSFEKRLEVILPPLAFALLFVFNVEDTFWFRLFYGPRMSYRIDNLFECMRWLDWHPAGHIGIMMGYGGAISLSLMIASSIGYLLFCLCWYKLIKDKVLVVNFVIGILYFYNIDFCFGILGPPLLYLRITLMELLFLATFTLIVIRNMR
ncbi:MAG: hypothetical protein ACTSR8_00910 [Promethearchaeota archaeon]